MTKENQLGKCGEHRKILVIVSILLVLIAALTMFVLYFTVGSRMNQQFYLKKIQSQSFIPFDRSKRMTETEVLADKEDVIRNVENTHPYFGIKEIAGYKEAKQKFLNAEIENATDFYFAASEYLAVFNDTHTGVAVGFTSYVKTGLSGYYENDKMMLYPYGRESEAFELIAINGVKITQIVGPYSSLENANTIARAYEKLFFVEYLHRAGIEISDFLTFTYRNIDGGSFDVVHNIAVESLSENTNSKTDTDKKVKLTSAVLDSSRNFAAEIRNGDILYITARSMQDDGSYQDCIDFIEKSVKNAIKKVVIDVTNNGGGNDGYGTGILNALGFEFSRKAHIIKYSNTTAEYTGTWRKDGLKVSTKFMYISKNKNNIQLKVFCNEFTGSASMAVIGACRYSNLGEIIGRMPGQNSDFCGNFVRFQPANSRIIYALPMTYGYYEKDGQKVSGGVVPDVFVPALESYMTYVVWK